MFPFWQNMYGNPRRHGAQDLHERTTEASLSLLLFYFPGAFFIPPTGIALGSTPFSRMSFSRAEGLFVLLGCPSVLFVVLSLGCALLFQRARSGEEEAEDVNSRVGTQRDRKEDLFILLLNAPSADFLVFTEFTE